MSDVIQTYKQLCRTVARDRLDTLTDGELAVALAHHDHILPEVAAEQSEFLAALDGTSPWLPHYRSAPELIGFLLVATAKRRALKAMQGDIEIAADELEQEARVDNEFEVHA